MENEEDFLEVLGQIRDEIKGIHSVLKTLLEKLG